MFLPNIPIELMLNRYSRSLPKSLKLNKFEFFKYENYCMQLVCLVGNEPVKVYVDKMGT